MPDSLPTRAGGRIDEPDEPDEPDELDPPALPGLDEHQERVVGLEASASGVVVGGPGSGKTAALIARVSALLRSDAVDPDQILVLTPTRASATSLRDRLQVAADRPTAGPLARSVAAFAFQIVRAQAVHAGEEPPQLLTGADEDQIIQDLLAGDAEDAADGNDRWPAWLPPDVRETRAFRTEVRTFLAECAALGIDDGALARLARAGGREAWEAMASFLGEYREVRRSMRGAHRDAAGLVREAAAITTMAASDDAALGAASALRVILVDDAQELTVAGVHLLEAWRRRGVAVLAFGDPDVGSGAFRGASPAHFARLAASLGSVHVLHGTHRGTPAMIALARRVTARIGTSGIAAHRAAPVPPAADDTSVRVLTARSASEELDRIARLLRERHVFDGVPWHDCAVISHDSAQVRVLEAELAAREVPTRAAGPGTPLGSRSPVRDLLGVIALAAREPASWTAEDVEGVLSGSICGLDPIGLRRLRLAMRHADLASGGSTPPREMLRSALANPLEFSFVDTREAHRAARAAHTLRRVREGLARRETPHELLWSVWEESGLERSWATASRGHGPLAAQADRDLDAVVALFEAAKRFVERTPDEDAMVFVRHVLDSDVAEDSLTAPAVAPAVRVLTPAAALGEQFDTVVVAGVQEGVWPNTRLRGGLLETWRLADAIVSGGAHEPDVLDRRREALHDELRLFVRAVTRARAMLAVSAVDDDDTGPSILFDLLPAPSVPPAGSEHPLSLRGLVARHRRTLTSGRADDPRAAGELVLLAQEGVAGAAPGEWYGMLPPTSTAALRSPEEQVRVSPSRVHTLEECELNWVIAELGGETASAAAGLGTILHSALETAGATDEESLWRVVEDRWGELEFEAPWRERAERHRARDLVRRLHRYLVSFEREGGRLLDAEPHFEIPLTPGDEHRGEVVLSGYIDRVEVTGAGEVVIVDLKTGKREPQTDAKVVDNPQLAAYQLALEHGLIPGADGLRPGGAKLLVLVPTATRRDWAEPRQAPLDDAARAAFLSRIDTAAATMAGAAFRAPFDEHCRKDHSYGLCRIHTIGAVSAP
ncbi:ATP-dependent DNA helicase [Microbacterium limosum]|uniref:DNA 3'-5' helicase n=1 Tax=Microbacterium limosum TaxID=3079935 RepID=A0AAU0MJP3_9MICO|nr:ATP-dependent DNA helicase [Microbacterium sp. Y20]WOQ70315.1 ATP-dependent DNA helicase [Microbacterium sp. Y20]